MSVQMGDGRRFEDAVADGDKDEDGPKLQRKKIRTFSVSLGHIMKNGSTVRRKSSTQNRRLPVTATKIADRDAFQQSQQQSASTMDIPHGRNEMYKQSPPPFGRALLSHYALDPEHINLNNGGVLPTVHKRTRCSSLLT